MTGTNQRKTGGAYRRQKQMTALYAKPGKDRNKAHAPKKCKRRAK